MKLKPEVKVGLFAIVAIIIVSLVTIQVGDQSIVAGGAYDLEVVFTNATGLYPKAIVEIAGVRVGVVKKVSLTPEGKALVTMGISKSAKIPSDSQVFLKSKGFLGEAYIEVVPGVASLALKEGEQFHFSQSGGDMSGLVNQFNSIASDISEITKTVKGWTSEKENGPIAEAVNNLDDFVRVMRDISVKNEENMDRILQNVASLTEDLREVVQKSKQDLTSSAENVAAITQKINEGKGTIGRLINDPETVKKLNDSLDSLSDALGGFKKLELGLDFHTEYLNRSNEFKNYVSVNLAPSPDEAFRFDIISDPTPDTTREKRITDVTVGGTTTKVTTENEVLSRDNLLFSAQLSKRFYDLTLRGGIIESKGGVGLDYQNGPVGLHFDAFDFETKFNEKPHLKLMGTVHMTQNLYLLGGADDPLNPQQKTDYFFGGGFRLVDENIKSLLGLAKFK